MTWKSWATLGVVGAAIALPILRKRMHGKSGFDSGNFDSAGNSVDSMGGQSAPASDTWAQSSTP